MALKLKTFVTSNGLTDFVVGTTSKTKALAAWGVGQDLVKAGQAHETEERLEAVVPVGFAGQHPEKEIDLGRRLDGRDRRSHERSGERRSLSASGVRASDQAPSRTIGTKVAAWKAMAYEEAIALGTP